MAVLGKEINGGGWGGWCEGRKKDRATYCDLVRLPTSHWAELLKGSGDLLRSCAAPHEPLGRREEKVPGDLLHP